MRTGIISIIGPKEPISTAWVRRGECLDTGYAHCAWYHPHYKLSAISAVEVPDKDIGPEYHLSVSKSGKRCSAVEAAFVIKQFGMTDAIEDNHSNVVRSYWLPVADDKKGIECDCKENETPVTEGDFTWRPITKANAEKAGAA
ncbi:MAG: hypothetical protein KKE94_07845 [Gammaproteobacteria bacterium]|nr:hypothetical protein [Gammaproteobacteria bacterium]